MKSIRTRAAGALATGITTALVLSACTGAPEPSPPEYVTITIGFWGESGIQEDATGPSLESVYEAEHPWVDLEIVSGEYGATHDALSQALIAGRGAPNVAMVDEGYITGFFGQAENFVNLIDLGALDHKDDYLPWKWQEAANADGSVVIGLGYDVGGLALCYRSDLFEAAGLPSDREDVSAALGDSWDDFVDFGRAYWAATGRRLIDNATNVFHPAVMQLGTGHGYYDRDNELDMDNIEPAFDTALYVIESGLSANIGLWSPEWNAGLTNGDFAVFVCSGWMLHYVEEVVSADTSFTGQWDIADLPGPGGNWGGSFYTIPRQGTANQQQEAYNFIEWLIQPEQQLKILAETGNLPSQTEILQSDEISHLTHPFFNDAPIGTIYSKTVLDVPGPIYHSPCEGAVRTTVEAVLNDMQQVMENWGAWDAARTWAETVNSC